MECIECKVINPDGNRFCGQCGAELGRSLEETIRKGFRDRQLVETEIAESVVARLMKWAAWLGSAAAVAVVLFGVSLGITYSDVRSAVNSGTSQISRSVSEGLNEVQAARQEIARVSGEVKQIEADVDRYRRLTDTIGRLQKELQSVRGEMVDLGARTLRVKELQTTGPGPSFLALTRLGCPPLQAGDEVLYCAQGKPLVLYQRTSGELRPVSRSSTA